jgi:ribosomal protein S18 acetylase RimI-like enzyme
MAFTVREALPDDLVAVLALYRHLNPADPELPVHDAQPVWDRLLHSPMTMVAVAEVDNFVAATCVLAIVPNLTRGARSFATIENVVTDPAYRSRGLGTAVLQFAMASAWERGCYKVMLSSGRTDESTLRFYEKAGFTRGGKTFFEVRRT